jgi:hypothetical protein
MSSDESINVGEPADSEGKNDDWYRERAKELYGVDGEIEVDNNARISRGDDPGAYVEAWLWVSDDRGTDGPKVPEVGKVKADAP